MKLRIRGNSIRIRLARSECARLGEELPVEQTTRFSPTSVLRSSVQPSGSATSPTAEFDAAGVRVMLPTQQARQWALSDQVTIEAHQQVDANTLLQILVEKDFQCIHSRAEGNVDAFPNPREREPEAACSSHSSANRRNI
jgi:hypothetical protein